MSSQQNVVPASQLKLNTNMAARIRTMTMVTGTGFTQAGGAAPVVRTWSYGSSRCEDITGNFTGDNPLEITHLRRQPSLITGSFFAGFLRVFENYLIDVGAECPHLTLPALESETIRKTRAIALGNPSRPVVDLPVFLFELKDLPRLLKATGDLLFKPKGPPAQIVRSIVRGKKPAETYLNWQFGWAPLLSDLEKLLGFTDDVDKRVAELRDLKDGSLSQSVTLAEDSKSETIFGGLHSSSGVNVTGQINTRTTRIAWGSTRWEPLADFPKTHDDMRAKARELVLGLSITPSTLWNMMPWSWLIDYFANVGTFLNATRNNLPCWCTSCCLMVKTSSARHWIPVTVSQPVVVTQGTSTRVTKTRAASSPTPGTESTLPFLSGKQLSNLTALAITRL